MKRLGISAFIAAYIGILTYGNLAHTLEYRAGTHPLMYLIVWDMFCGWSSYATEIHLVAESETEKFYELAPGPWGEFRPWGGEYARHNYDPYFNHSVRMALNTLRHTTHDPIARIYVIEESWPKRYDIPDPVWKLRYGDQPKDVHRYCHVKTEMLPDGTVMRTGATWLSKQWFQQVAANPALQAKMQRSRPVFVVSHGPGEASANFGDQTRTPYDNKGGFTGLTNTLTPGSGVTPGN